MERSFAVRAGVAAMVAVDGRGLGAGNGAASDQLQRSAGRGRPVYARLL